MCLATFTANLFSTFQANERKALNLLELKIIPIHRAKMDRRRTRSFAGQAMSQNHSNRVPLVDYSFAAGKPAISLFHCRRFA
jgi:hypothetical protein